MKFAAKAIHAGPSPDPATGAIMSHASIPKDVRESYGLRDSLILLSVGIEDRDDQIEDLAQALEAAHR